jgi:hypothetical protein
MIVNIPLLLLALLLLWFPRPWLRAGAVLLKRRLRPGSSRAKEPWNIREPGDPRVYFTTEFSKIRNYVDLLRAAAGATCVMGEGWIDACLQVPAGARSGQVWGLLAVKSAILLVGLLIQTLRYEKRRVTFYPPIFFLAGLSVPLCSPWAAFFAFAMIWAVHPMFGDAQGFLTVYALLMAGFGFYFNGFKDKTVILAAIFCFLPTLLSLMAQRPLVIFSRKGKQTPTAAS